VISPFVSEATAFRDLSANEFDGFAEILGEVGIDHDAFPTGVRG
jgi:hypothetical protein